MGRSRRREGRWRGDGGAGSLGGVDCVRGGKATEAGGWRVWLAHQNARQLHLQRPRDSRAEREAHAPSCPQKRWGGRRAGRPCAAAAVGGRLRVLQGEPLLDARFVRRSDDLAEEELWKGEALEA